MLVPRRIICGFTKTLCSRRPLSSLTFTPSSLSIMPRKQRRGGNKEQRWIEKPDSNRSERPSTSHSTSVGSSNATTEAVTDRLNALSFTERNRQPNGSLPSVQFGSIHVPVQGQEAVWKPKSYGTVSGAKPVEVDKAPVNQTVGLGNVTQTSSAGKQNAALSKLFDGSLLENFTVDNSTYSSAQVRATFYPKFENEKTDQEVRTRMIEMVSKGLATLEVSLKHSGSLFMYAGHEGGAYAKNSYGNV